ncbi:uncharacterized protein [Palaemon carinicauda]|uniref:uncharacterized protein n=1 Tax=Palaemon carinicauda TaxID=392227 RepID=UPI0035B5936F
MSLAPPVPKKFRGEVPQQGDPLPIPIASYTGFPSSAASWNYYKGVYKDGLVIVTDLNQIASLWHNGYFGQLKNTDLHNDEFVREESYKYAKRWKLLETDGIKDTSFFKKPVESEANDAEGEADSDSSKTKEKELDQNIDYRESVPDNKNKSSSFENTRKGTFKTESPLAVKRDAERGEKASPGNCRTLLSLESDHLPSIFFDDDVNSSSRGHLELLPEEAMYLSYALGCLVVEKEWVAQGRPQQFKGKQKQGSKEFTIDQLWRKLVNDDQKFVARYAVYHHYRAKGWVVRSGLKFGADYVLYPVGPPFYHAQFTVMIQCVWSDTNARDDSLSSREMSWTNFSATERLNTHVKKTPLISYVLRPRSLTSEGLYKISCLKSLVVKEVVLSRWDPNAAVEPEKDEITID